MFHFLFYCISDVSSEPQGAFLLVSHNSTALWYGMVWYGILYCPNGKFVLGSQLQPLHQTIKTNTIHQEQRNTHLKTSS